MHSTSIHAVQPEPFMETVSNFLLEYIHAESIIFAVSHTGQRVELGQMVTSNKSLGRPIAGTKGIVIEICRPYSHGRSSDILRVHFEGNHIPHWVKFSDLSL